MTPLFWLFVVAGVISLDARIVAPVLPAIAASLAVAPGQAGYGMTAYTLSYGALQLVYGPLSDRYGRVRVVRTTALGFVLGTALSGLATSLWGFAAARLLTGAFAAATIPATLSYIGDTVPYERRYRAIGRFSAVISSAQALSAALAGTVTYVISWRLMFGLYAVLTLVAAAALFRVGETVPPVRPPRERERLGWAAILAMPATQRLYTAVVAEGAFVWGSTTYIGVLAKQRFGFNDLEVGLAFACYGAGTIVGGLTLARARARASERGLLRTGGLVQGTALVVMAAALPWPVFTLCLAGLGLGLSWLHSTLQTRATELVPAARGKAFSLFPFCFFMGGAIGTAALGGLVDAGRFSLVLMICGAGLAGVGWVSSRRTSG